MIGLPSRRVLAALALGGAIWFQASKQDLDFKKPGDTQQIHWQRFDGGERTLDECEKTLAVQADLFEFFIKKRDPDAKRHGAAFLSHDRTNLYVHQFFCFPDTVDPRGPKEK